MAGPPPYPPMVPPTLAPRAPEIFFFSLNPLVPKTGKKILPQTVEGEEGGGIAGGGSPMVASRSNTSLGLRFEKPEWVLVWLGTGGDTLGAGGCWGLGEGVGAPHPISAW